jgi:hypothetical protein
VILANFTRTAGSGAALGMVMLVGMLVSSPRGQAQGSNDTARIQQGLAIAPVPLNLVGLDPNLVGLGSYIVNASSGCNGCHNPGPGGNEFLPGGNPYFGQSKTINTATYLGGGRDFGPLGPAGSAHIISRNLTPDKTGLPEGGHTFAEFVQIMRAGVDLDHLHPTCSSGNINSGCVPPPFNGNLLQIMPWPDFKDMNDLDLQAIFAYLSAIPCVAGPPAPDPLHNDCGTPPPPGGASPITITVTGPGSVTSASNTFVTNSNQITPNASQSTSTNAGALAFSWTASPAFRGAILFANTATPIFQLPSRGTYQFTLTVTDATGATATATITVQYS